MKSEEDRRVDEPKGIRFLFEQRLPFRVSSVMMFEILNQARWFFNCDRYQPNQMVVDMLAAYMEVKITHKENGLECTFTEKD